MPSIAQGTSRYPVNFCRFTKIKRRPLARVAFNFFSTPNYASRRLEKGAIFRGLYPLSSGQTKLELCQIIFTSVVASASLNKVLVRCGIIESRKLVPCDGFHGCHHAAMCLSFFPYLLPVNCCAIWKVVNCSICRNPMAFSRGKKSSKCLQ